MKGMLSCTNIFQVLHGSFSRIKEPSQRTRQISLVDVLSSGFPVFSLKYPSLLQFEQHHGTEEVVKHNLHSVFKIQRIPPIHKCVKDLMSSQVRRSEKHSKLFLRYASVVNA